MQGPEILVPLGFFSMVTVIAVGVPYVRALARRMDRDGAGSRMPSDVTARLERMEHAIDAIAVEVERISEGQRFTTQLLAERSEAAAVPGAGAPAARRGDLVGEGQ